MSLRSAVNVENGVRFDRLVLEFADGVPGYRAQFVPQVVRPGSGAPLPLAGQTAFELVLTSAAAHDDQGASTLRTAPDGTGPSGLSYALAGDFEGTVHIGVGLSRVAGFRIVELTGPDRLAVDFLS
ncbi:AMIN-like domain-containing (lipo)protein [Candidatus Frankia alpina]|uniref:AMIN-like domain-containing (lipo)protein n=1 Tax=Candidatus Frankia alpina TaxID=2699483 RepID=UPI001F2F47D0